MAIAATIDPSSTHEDITLSNGNMTGQNPTYENGNGVCCWSTIYQPEGKYYVEFELDTLPTDTYPMGAACGFGNFYMGNGWGPGYNTKGVGFCIDETIGSYGAIRMRYNSGWTTIYEKAGPPAYTDGDVMMLAIDIDLAGTAKIWVGVNDTWQGDPAAGTGEAKTWDFTAGGGDDVAIALGLESNGQITVVTDPDNQTYSAPASFAGKWAVALSASISGSLGASCVTDKVREFEASITGGLGVDGEPHDLTDAFISGLLGLSGPVIGLRDRSPISGDVGLGELIEMYRWHGGLFADQDVSLGAVMDSYIQFGPETITSNLGLGCSVDCINYSEFVRSNPDVTKNYICQLTGAANNTTDITLPISSFQGRLRSGSQSFLSVQIPSYQYIDDVLARIDGDIVVISVLLVAGVEMMRQEIARVHLDDPRTDRGGNSQTITLSGHRQETYSPQTITLQSIQEIGESNGKMRVVSAIDLFLRPGHTVIVTGEDPFIVGLISYVVNDTGETMEVTEA